MTSTFITNAPERTLKKRLEQLIQFSQELKFLVGFFYFSGWRELYQALKDRPDLTFKLLVGLDVGRALGDVLEIAASTDNLSQDELAERFFNSLRVALNDEALDTAEFYDQVNFFLERLESGQLQIKKTREPNHAKLYFFKVKAEVKGLLPNDRTYITGSSNLTRAGLGGQNEFNVELAAFGAEEAEAYFDALWETAIPITEIPQRRKDLIHLVENRTQAAIVTPFEAYALTLKAYLDIMELTPVSTHILRVLKESGYKDYQYQLDAVTQALTILEEYHGVIIADVVGLGKSVIAGMLGRGLGKRGLVLCPPSLIGDNTSGWKKYRNDFKLYDWEVESSGDLRKVAEKYPEQSSDIEVVIIDEAHRFRNEDTESYAWLSVICRGRKVILLTATPFNNAPADIFALLKLFIVPGKSKITLDENLEGRFARYNREFRNLSYIMRYHNSSSLEKRSRAEKFFADLFEAPLPIDLSRIRQRAKDLAQEIRSVIEPVLIRRNRLDLKNHPVYSTEITELSEVADPVEQFFALTPAQLEFYDRVVNDLFGENGRFHGAIYQPFIYEEGLTGDGEGLDEAGNRAFQQQRNLFDFMRRLLVKRFESSFGAFAKSIANFENVHEKVLVFIEKSGGKYILDRSLIEKIYEGDPDEIEKALEEFANVLAAQENLSKHDKIYRLAEFKLKDEFLQDIQADLQLMREVKEEIARLNLVADDPKAKKLIERLRWILTQKPAAGEPRRKVVIFSEYVDTVKHLRPILEEAFPGAVLSVEGFLPPVLIRQILANFDASQRAEKQQDEYQILLTSDKLSEGVNLNRAGAIVNYDIPWNPTRVIQRVGRINRIGRKVFQVLNIYNFFPTEQGADIIKSREIAAQKMFLIHTTLGEDAKIFNVDEIPTPAELFKRVNQNPDEEEPESMLTEVRRRYFEIKQLHPEVIERISKLPARVKTARAAGENQLMVFRRKGLGMFIHLVEDTRVEDPKAQPVLFEQALDWMACTPEEPRRMLSKHFWKSYEAVKSFREVMDVPKSESSLYTKALNNLHSALKYYKAELDSYVPFINTLISDLRDYKTLPKFTLRTLTEVNLIPGNPEGAVAFRMNLEKLRRRLGEDYLEDIKQRLGELKSEVIIAVEKQTSNHE